jgi:hypothetical protein
VLTPRKHFEIDVRPPCEAYFQDSTSQWKAKAAAQAISNFAEWTFHYFEKNEPQKLFGTKGVGDYKTYHASACPSFRIVWDLADAAKHRFLTRHLEQRIVTTATGGWAETADTLEIVATGEEVDVLIGVAMTYWESQI